jgi:hypothetical protein
MIVSYRLYALIAFRLSLPHFPTRPNGWRSCISRASTELKAGQTHSRRATNTLVKLCTRIALESTNYPALVRIRTRSVISGEADNVSSRHFMMPQSTCPNKNHVQAHRKRKDRARVERVAADEALRQQVTPPHSETADAVHCPLCIHSITWHTMTISQTDSSSAISLRSQKPHECRRS